MSLESPLQGLLQATATKTSYFHFSNLKPRKLLKIFKYCGKMKNQHAEMCTRSQSTL